MARAVMFPRGVQDDLASISLALDSSREEPAELTLHLREASASGDFSSTDDVATARGVVPPAKESLVEFRVDRKIRGPYVWVWLPRTEGVSWRLMETAPLGSCRAYGGDNSWHVVESQYYAFFTRPPLAIETDCRVENVTNGASRTIGDAWNLWASDPAMPMPAWVQLDFESSLRINTVYLTFDTDMNTSHHTLSLVPQCVRDYELAYHDGSKWTVLVIEKGNFQRRRVHRFDAVSASKLRLMVQATNGDPSARVFEIRVYDE